MPQKTWKISNNVLDEGVTYALKNSDNLCKSSKILLKNGNYVHALSIATLALEEFGKHCILKENWMRGNDISSSYWINVIKKHDKKLEAIPNHLEQAGPPPDVHLKKELNKFKKYLLELAKRKLENLYVDWDDIKQKWMIVENSKSIKKQAEKAVETAQWVIEKYIEDLEWDRKLILTPPKEIIQLFRMGKIYSFCKKCGIVMLNQTELVHHNRLTTGHVGDISWHYI